MLIALEATDPWLSSSTDRAGLWAILNDLLHFFGVVTKSFFCVNAVALPIGASIAISIEVTDLIIATTCRVHLATVARQPLWAAT